MISWLARRALPRSILINRRNFRKAASRFLRLLEKCLLEITGMDAITLQPAAGAHGEMTGLLLIRAYLEKQGNPRKKVLISRFRARDESGNGGDRGLRSRKHQVRVAWAD